MKRTSALLAALLLFHLSHSQSFEKGNRNVDINFGLGIYNTTVKENKSTTDSVSKGKAGCTVLAPAMEWGVGKSISVGGSLLYSSFLTATDSTGKRPKARGLDGNFLLNFHFVKSSTADIFAGIRLGLAGFRLNPDDGSGSIYGSMGSAFDVHLGGRFYVSDKVAIVAGFTLPSYTFKKFGQNIIETSTLKFRGYSIGTGISFRLKSKTEAPAGK